MPDEIDLLRWFREDTPEPDDAAWNRARIALAEARAGEPGAQPAPARPHRSPWRKPSRRATLVTAAAVVVVAAAALIVVVMQRPPTLAGRLTTAWQSARPLPGSAHPARAPSGTWRLMSYLVARGWQENTAGPEPGGSPARRRRPAMSWATTPRRRAARRT